MNIPYSVTSFFIYNKSIQIFTAVAVIRIANMIWSTFVFIFLPIFRTKWRGNDTCDTHYECRKIIDLTCRNFTNGRTD